MLKYEWLSFDGLVWELLVRLIILGGAHGSVDQMSFKQSLRLHGSNASENLEDLIMALEWHLAIE